MIVNPVTGKHHTLNSKKGRDTLKLYLKTYKDGLERKERVEEGTRKMWEKKSVQKPSLNLENIQPTHLLTDYLDTDSLSKLTTLSSSLKDVGERVLDDRYKYYKHGDGNILRNCLICDKPLRDTPRKAIIKLSCGCVFHYDCVLEYIRKVEDRIDIAKTNTKQWDITNEVIPSTELDPVTLGPIVATRRNYSTRHNFQKYNPISMIQNYFYGPRGNPELVGRRATNVPDDYFWRTSPSQPMPMEEALDEFVRHRNREPRYGRKRAMEKDIRKARRCPACFKTLMNTIHSKRL